MQGTDKLEGLRPPTGNELNHAIHKSSIKMSRSRLQTVHLFSNLSVNVLPPSLGADNSDGLRYRDCLSSAVIKDEEEY